MNIFKKSNNSAPNPRPYEAQEESTGHSAEYTENQKLNVKPVKGGTACRRTASRESQSRGFPLKKKKSTESRIAKTETRKRNAKKEKQQKAKSAESTTTLTTCASETTTDNHERHDMMLLQAKREAEAAIRLRDKIDKHAAAGEKETALSEKLQQRKKGGDKSPIVPKKDFRPVNMPPCGSAPSSGGSGTTSPDKNMYSPPTAQYGGIAANPPSPVVNGGPPNKCQAVVGADNGAVTVSSMALTWDEKTQIQTVTVTNKTDTRRACKIKCSDNRNYLVNPVYFIIEAKRMQIVSFTKNQPVIKADKFVLLHCKTDKNSAQDSFDMFAQDLQSITITTVPDSLDKKS